MEGTRVGKKNSPFIFWIRNLVLFLLFKVLAFDLKRSDRFTVPDN